MFAFQRCVCQFIIDAVLGIGVIVIVNLIGGLLALVDLFQGIVGGELGSVMVGGLRKAHLFQGIVSCPGVGHCAWSDGGGV